MLQSRGLAVAVSLAPQFFCFGQICHIAPSLRLLVLSILQVCRPLLSEGTCLWHVYSFWQMALQHCAVAGTSSCFNGVQAFLPCWLVLMLPPSNLSSHSLLRSTCHDCHGLLADASLWACFRNQLPLLLNFSFFLGGCTIILASAWWEPL
jgi:hypothetical protein